MMEAPGTVVDQMIGLAVPAPSTRAKNGRLFPGSIVAPDGVTTTLTTLIVAEPVAVVSQVLVAIT